MVQTIVLKLSTQIPSRKFLNEPVACIKKFQQNNFQKLRETFRKLILNKELKSYIVKMKSLAISRKYIQMNQFLKIKPFRI